MDLDRGRSRHLALALTAALVAAQGLAAPARATPTGTARGKRTTLTRVRTAHEMVTTHARELEPTRMRDGTLISAKPHDGGSRVTFRYEDGGEDEYTLDHKGRTRALVTLHGEELDAYRRIGKLGGSNGGGGEVLLARSAERLTLRLHLDQPLDGAGRVTLALETLPQNHLVLIHDLKTWDADAAHTTFDLAALRRAGHGGTVRVFGEIDAGGRTERIWSEPFRLED